MMCSWHSKGNSRSCPWRFWSFLEAGLLHILVETHSKSLNAVRPTLNGYWQSHMEGHMERFPASILLLFSDPLCDVVAQNEIDWHEFSTRTCCLLTAEPVSLLNATAVLTLTVTLTGVKTSQCFHSFFLPKQHTMQRPVNRTYLSDNVSHHRTPSSSALLFPFGVVRRAL